MTPRPLTLITGATGGIGRAIAAALAPEHDLILQGRNTEALERLRSELQNISPAAQVHPLTLDLTHLVTFADATADLRPTHLIHNAGVAELGTVGEQGHAAWTQTLAVNVVAPAELTRVLLPSVREARGTVVFINSGAGLRAGPGWGSYAASKHALKALADSLRQEEAEAGSGVRVSSLYPGRTASEMQRRIRQHEGQPYDPGSFIQPGTVADVVRYVLSAPRDVSLEDVTVRPGPS